MHGDDVMNPASSGGTGAAPARAPGPAGISANVLSVGPNVLIVAPGILYILNTPAHWPAAGTVAVAVAGVVAVAAAWVAIARSRRAATGRYLGVPEAGGLGPQSIRARLNAVGAEASARYGPEVGQVVTRGSRRCLAGRFLYHLCGAVAFASLAADVTIGGGAVIACLLISVALCAWSFAATLLGRADDRAAVASARERNGGQPPGLGMPREQYIPWCEEQGRDPYPFGRPV